MPRRAHDVEERRGFIKSLCVFGRELCGGARKLGLFGPSSRSTIPPLRNRHRRPTRTGNAHSPERNHRRPERQTRTGRQNVSVSHGRQRILQPPSQQSAAGTVARNVVVQCLGQYSFHTIKPAHYGDVSSPPPMHIHVHLQLPDGPEHWVESFYFVGRGYSSHTSASSTSSSCFFFLRKRLKSRTNKP